MKRRNLKRFVCLLTTLLFFFSSINESMAYDVGNTGDHSTITMHAGESTFTYKIVFDTIEEAYASAQFDVTTGNSKELTATDISFETDIINKVSGTANTLQSSTNGSYQIGFFSPQNQFSHGRAICTITFRYIGDTPQNITINGLKIWRFTGRLVDGIPELVAENVGWNKTITVTRSTVTPPIGVTALTVIGKDGVAKITTKGGTLQMVATVTPSDATNKAVTWSIVSGDKYASLSDEGLLTAKANGTVTVKATSVSNPLVSNICNIAISGNSSGGGSGGGGNTTNPVVPTVPSVTNPSTPDAPRTEPVKVIISLTTGTVSREGTGMTLTVKPYVENGRTMIGVRDVAGMLHVEQKDVVWNAKDKSIVISAQGILIKLVIGQKYAIVNGQKVALDVAPQIKDGRTVLPVAQIARLLNIETQYDAKTKEITFIIKK